MTTHQHKTEKGARFSYEYRVGQVKGCLNLSGQATAYDLAKCIGLSQQRTNALLKRMAFDGYLEFLELPHRTNTIKRVWSWKGKTA